jgi:hypothetical protein
MNRVEKVLKKLSELYEFNRELKRFRLKDAARPSLKKDAAKSRRAS